MSDKGGISAFVPGRHVAVSDDRAVLDALDMLGHAGANYDNRDRLIAFNKTFRHFFSTIANDIHVGITYQALLESCWDNGVVPAIDVTRTEWVDRLMTERHQFGTPQTRRMADGLICEIVHQPTADGGLLSILQDVTQQHQNATKERDRRKLFEDFAATMADWLWETDDKHRFLGPGEGQVASGGMLSEFFGRTRWDVANADIDGDPIWREHLQTLRAHGPFRDFRYEHRQPDGTLRRSRITGSPIFADDGAFMGYRGFGIDETALFEAADRAVRAESLVQEAVNSLTEGVALHDADGSLLLWNRAFENIYAKSPLNLSAGMSFEDVVRELAHSGLTNTFGLTREEWIQKRLSLPRPNPDPVERQIDGRWYQIRETATASGGMAILMTDITELKVQQTALIAARNTLESRVAERTRSLADAVEHARAEARQRSEAEALLSESVQKFRNIAEGSVQGFYVQQDFQLVYANPALAKLLGYGSGQDLLDKGDINNFLAASVRDELRQRNNDRKAGIKVPERYETRFLHQDGHEFWVELFVSQITWEGIPSVLVSVVDIHNQKLAQAALAETESDYKAIFDHASDGIYRSSIDGQNLRANPALARMNGFESEEEVHGARTDLDGEWYVEPGRRAEFRKKMMADGYVENFVSEVYRYKTRERIWISENARLVRDEQGEPLYFEGTVRDITQQRKIEMDLRSAIRDAERANYAKSQFLAKMSHELRTPLNAIIGFSEIIGQQVMGPVGSERYIGYAGDIRHSGKHLLSLINDLLDLSKIEAGEMALDIEDVDLASVLHESAYLITHQADQRNISINIAHETANQVIRVDRRSFKQIMLNLLSNAVKFNSDNGWITVQTRHEPGHIMIDVTDGGIGIESGDLGALFTPFGQVSNQLVAQYEGTGLGLPIVKSLVELHGGEVIVNSRPDEGTTITIKLPANQDADRTGT